MRIGTMFGNPKSFHREYVVTNVNENFMYFQCKMYGQTIFVNAALFCYYYNLELPKPGTKINLVNYSLHNHLSDINNNQIISLCFKKNPKDFTVARVKKNTIMNLIEKYKLGYGDLLEIMKMYEYLTEDAPIAGMNLDQFIFRFVENALSSLKSSETVLRGSFDCCLQRLPRIDLRTVTHMKQILEIGNSYNGFPYWSFGTRWSSKSEILVGTLTVHPKLGTICLTDSKYKVGCIIIKNLLDDVKEILEKPVYIEKFCVISEIFNPNSKFNLEYLYFHYEHVHILDNKRKRPLEAGNFKYRMSFVLMNKSNVTFTTDKGIHFWIEICDIKNYNLNSSHCFLCLNENFVRDWAFLEGYRIFTLRFNKELIRTRDGEYVRVNPKLSQFMLRPDNSAALIFENDYTQPQTLLFLNKDTLPDILKTKGLVSFQAVLKNRKFVESNSSRTKIGNIPPFFGTLGHKTHLLDFKVDKVECLSLYMNNWERMMTPIGLVPEAVVNVKNIIIQKTYCKSTAFTFLEVVKYEPQINFLTARLLEEEDWGLPNFIGGSKSLPNGVLVHCLIIHYRILKLHLKRSCQTCSYMSRIKGEACVKCNGEMRTVCSILVLVKDARGVAKITINRLEMARVFFGMRDDEWKLFLDNFQSIGQFNFQRYEQYINTSLKYENLKFINKLNYVVKCEERLKSRKIRLLCRKIDNTLYRGKVETFWFGLKAKFADECY